MDKAALYDFLAKLYYERLATNVADLGNLYREGSWMAFQGEKIQGKESILTKLSSHTYARCKRRITTVDCHPSDAAGGLLVFVNGVLDEVQQDGTEHGLKFSQLMATPEGDFYILNDIFRVAAPPQSQVMEGVLVDVATAVHS